jgi:hypothetical protein
VLQYPNIRQCAVYGIGQLVLHAPAMVAPVLSDVLAGIVAVVQAEGARDPENNSATENAVATMGETPFFLPFSVPVPLSYLQLCPRSLALLRQDPVRVGVIIPRRNERQRLGIAVAVFTSTA